MTTPDVLAFADKKTDGSYAVTEPCGATVAWIKVSTWSSTKFEAFHDHGEPLCHGRQRGIFSGWWDVSDPRDRLLASLKSGFSGSRKRVLLADERELTLQGRWLTRDWALRDASGHDVLTSEPTNSSWSFRPDAWVVRSHDASLDLATMVGIVQLNRLMVKSARASSSSAAT